jgi:hypothetical protein
MPFSVSPGVAFREIDLTTNVPAVSTTECGIAGVFAWGPVDRLILVESEQKMALKVGKPNNNNFETWFVAASCLGYGNKVYLSRAIDSTARSALANTGAVANTLSQRVHNDDHYTTVTPDANCFWIAKYPGELGNSLKISSCESANAYNSQIDLIANSSVTADTEVTYVAGSNAAIVEIVSQANAAVSYTVLTNVLAGIAIGDILEVGNANTGRQFVKVTAKGAITNSTANSDFIATANLSLSAPVTLVSNVTSNTINRYWEYFNEVDRAPNTSVYMSNLGLTAKDELHVVIVDAQGKFTGAPGTVLERWKALSRATDSKQENGGANYYKTVINAGSNYVWVGSENSNAVSNTSNAVVSSSNILPRTFQFAGGLDTASEGTIAIGSLTTAYDLFANADELDISVIMQGKARGSASSGASSNVNSYSSLANYLIQNICEVRRDAVTTLSPARDDVVNAIDPLTNVLRFRNNLATSSYGIMDSGYKYMYDKYNNEWRWVPLNGDIAGTIVRTDNVADPWYSPAGYNRGQIKNCVRVAYNPGSLAERDQLYKADINPVVTFHNQGTLLYGDKTLYGRPSAFDRINVRRLFIVMEKAISRAARSLLFEFNDEFTRRQFIALVDPYLRNIQGRRGIYEYYIKCDDENNDGGVIDRNEFVGDIYVKPARSANFIQLNFVAVGTSVQFQEVVGGF